mmetsp:Transcript_88323/g.245132  ORF Transcript_88323/g.245132 Transcript_88323/m.245132 type:complete len:220 (+) Transcript_88323:69-728(+)
MMPKAPTGTSSPDKFACSQLHLHALSLVVSTGPFARTPLDCNFAAPCLLTERTRQRKVHTVAIYPGVTKGKLLPAVPTPHRTWSFHMGPSPCPNGLKGHRRLGNNASAVQGQHVCQMLSSLACSHWQLRSTQEWCCSGLQHLQRASFLSPLQVSPHTCHEQIPTRCPSLSDPTTLASNQGVNASPRGTQDAGCSSLLCRVLLLHPRAPSRSLHDLRALH